MRNFQIAGYLGNTPELQSNDETSWTRLRIATNDGAKTEWFNVTAFGKLAQAIVDNLGKGDGIALRGHLRINRHDGREFVELIAQGADFFAKKKEDN